MNDYEQYKRLLVRAGNKFKETIDEKYYYLVYQDSECEDMIMAAKFTKQYKTICGIYIADAIHGIDEF